MINTNKATSNNTNLNFIDFEFIRNSVKFEKENLFSLYLKDVYDDLSSREPSQKGISKLAFSDYVKFPVFISEKIFSALDKDSKGYINEKEFLQGFTKLYLGNFLETAEMIFKILDFDKDGLITPGDVKVLLSYLPLKDSESKEIVDEYKNQMKNLEELDEVLLFTLENIKNKLDKKFNFEKFIEIITIKCSDIYLHFLCFLYLNKPFHIEQVNSYKLQRQVSIKKPINNSSTSTNTNEKLSLIKISFPAPKTMAISSTKKYIELVSLKFKQESEKENSSEVIVQSSKVMQNKNIPVKSSTSNISLKNKFGNGKNTILSNTTNLNKKETNFDLLQTQSKFSSNKNLNSIVQQNFTIKQSNLKQEVSTLSTNKSEINLNKIDKIKITINNSCDNEIEELTTESSLKTLSIDNSNSFNSTTPQSSKSSHINFQLEDIKYEDYVFLPQSDKSVKKVYMVLIGREIILYSDNKKDEKVSFLNLSGSFIKDYNDSYTAKNKTSYFQIKIVVNKNRSKHFLFACKNTKDTWLDKLTTAIGYRNFFDYYSLEDDLDYGRFGKVKLGINKSTGEKVAIKVIKKDELQNKELLMMKTELDIMKLFRHPNIVNLLDHFENNIYIFIVMEYLSGGNLCKYLFNLNNKLTEKQAGKIIFSVASGIKYMNSFGIIHRDIKPENIMFSNNETSSSVKIIDFGLIKTLSPNENLNEGVGTLNYVAPEVLTRKPYNKEVDVWSLGIIMYKLLSGNGLLPFDDEDDDEETIGRNIVFLDHHYPNGSFIGVSKEATQLIDACLTKNIENRISIEDILKHAWIKANSN